MNLAHMKMQQSQECLDDAFLLYRNQLGLKDEVI